MGIKSGERHVRTRLYFTSESHIHAILNVIRFAYLADPSIAPPSLYTMHRLEEVDELNYLSHVVFRLYEVTTDKGDKRFSMRISFSNGVGLFVDVGPEGNLENIKVGTQAAEAPPGNLQHGTLQRISSSFDAKDGVGKK